MMKKGILSVLLMILGFFCFCAQAEATWYWTHGNSGHLDEDSAVAFNTSVKHKEEGLQVNPNSSAIGVVHFAVPTIGETTQGVRFIRIRLNMVHAVNTSIRRVQVFRGGTLIKTFTVNWNATGVQTQQLDLGRIVAFTEGLGVSIQFEAGPDAGIDQFIIQGVGANFVPKP